jgi:hypothetical protein
VLFGPAKRRCVYQVHHGVTAATQLNRWASNAAILMDRLLSEQPILEFIFSGIVRHLSLTYPLTLATYTPPKWVCCAASQQLRQDVSAIIEG